MKPASSCGLITSKKSRTGHLPDPRKGDHRYNEPGKPLVHHHRLHNIHLHRRAHHHKHQEAVPQNVPLHLESLHIPLHLTPQASTPKRIQVQLLQISQQHQPLLPHKQVGNKQVGKSTQCRPHLALSELERSNAQPHLQHHTHLIRKFRTTLQT